LRFFRFLLGYPPCLSVFQQQFVGLGHPPEAGRRTIRSNVGMNLLHGPAVGPLDLIDLQQRDAGDLPFAEEQVAG